MSAQPLLQVSQLSLSFESATGTQEALKQVSFTVHRNEVVALVGESGSGKSVTSLSIMQLLPSPPARFTSGEIWLAGKKEEAPVNILSLDKKSLQQIRGNRVAMIFQEPMTSLNPVLTCGRQVVEAIRLHRKVSAAEARQIALNWFEKVKLPNPASIFRRYPHQLSGGQKQRVMIAMALCCEPDLLICDEPTTALDVTVQKTILQLIRELQRQTRMGVIFITHDLGVVAEVADRAVVMYRGEIVEQNTVRELFLHPQHPYTRALLACRPAAHRKGERLPVVADFLEPERSSGTVRAVVPEKSGTTDSDLSPLVKVENLSVWFPATRSLLGRPRTYTRALDNVSFEISRGETLGLVGESGCGKTTLGRTLLRLIPPTHGRIWLDGKDFLALPAAELKTRRRDLQIIFQDPYSSLNPRMTIGQAIAEPMRVHGLIRQESARRDKVVELLEKVSLRPEHFQRYPHEFSGGQRQRIVIARALALNPSFLVCDESVSALDVSVQAQVLNLLNDLKKEFGFTVVFISHDLSVVRYLSDRIMVMHQGKIVESGDAEQVYTDPREDYTRQLIAAIPRPRFD